MYIDIVLFCSRLSPLPKSLTVHIYFGYILEKCISLYTCRYPMFHTRTKVDKLAWE